MKKLIFSFIAILLLCIVLSSITFETQAIGLDIVKDKYDNYVSEKVDGEPINNEGIVDVANIIVSLIRIVGISIAVVMLAIIGIKYIMGSVEEKAEYKQTMWPYVVGAILLVGGSSLVSMIYTTFFGE